MPHSERNPKYDGLMVFLPDVSMMRSGDILLTFNAESDDAKGSKQSKLIRRLAGGTFSHALICSVPPTMIEAIGPGVSTLSLARCFAHNLDNVRILRFPDEKIAAKAAGLAQMEVGRDYSVPKALSSIFPSQIMRKIKDDGTFCSALVAQAFCKAGADIFAATPVEKTTPATIERLQGLVDLTTAVFRKTLAPNNIEQMCALDGERTYSPSERQTEINSRYARALAPLADRIAADYPEARLSAPITLFQVIQFIMDAKDRSPDIAATRQSTYDAIVANLDTSASELISSGELAGVFAEMLEADERSDQYSLKQSFAVEPDIDKSAMRNYFQTSKVQIEKRQAALQGFLAWGVHRSKSVQAYVDLESATVSTMKRRIILIEEILTRID